MRSWIVTDCILNWNEPQWLYGSIRFFFEGLVIGSQFQFFYFCSFLILWFWNKWDRCRCTWGWNKIIERENVNVESVTKSISKAKKNKGGAKVTEVKLIPYNQWPEKYNEKIPSLRKRKGYKQHTSLLSIRYPLRQSYLSFLFLKNIENYLNKIFLEFTSRSNLKKICHQTW